jgi:hypothetical protein
MNMFVFWAAVEILIGYILLTNRVPESVYNLLWFSTAGYFSRSVPDPDRRFLRAAGGLMIVDGILFLLGKLFLSDGFPDWSMDPLGLAIVVCLALAFILPWIQPFQKSKRDQEWKEMVLDPTDEEKKK